MEYNDFRKLTKPDDYCLDVDFLEDQFMVVLRIVPSGNDPAREIARFPKQGFLYDGGCPLWLAGAMRVGKGRYDLGHDGRRIEIKHITGEDPVTIKIKYLWDEVRKKRRCVSLKLDCIREGRADEVGVESLLCRGNDMPYKLVWPRIPQRSDRMDPSEEVSEDDERIQDHLKHDGPWAEAEWLMNLCRKLGYR